MTGDRYSDELYKQLVSSSCTILLTPADKEFLDPNRVMSWIDAYSRLQLPGGIDMLLSQAPTCLTQQR